MCVIVAIWNCLYFMGKKIKIKIEAKTTYLIKYWVHRLELQFV